MKQDNSIVIGISLIMLTFWSIPAGGQIIKNQPHIGYLYPAGGQRGTSVQITIGGQFLRGASEVFISGKGIHGSVIKYYRPLRNLTREQRQLLVQRLQEVRDKRLAELPGYTPVNPAPDGRKTTKSNSSKTKAKTKANASAKSNAKGSKSQQTSKSKSAAEKTPEVKMPEHPLLYDLENKSLRELAHIRSIIFASRRKQQMNRQIAELALVQITIDRNAEIGNHELRIRTPNGITNPMIFQVGLLPEVKELEPNDQKAFPTLSNLPTLPNLSKWLKILTPKPLELPVLLNGQILPGDVDRFRFRARQGQLLVIEAQSRSLIPYLADAVPGWFQATVALYDAAGNEVAYIDDYRFNPDPVLFYRVARDGEYELEIHDAIYRGREDFVYRIAVGENPFITSIYPLGGRTGVRTAVSLQGWNLATNKLLLDTRPGKCDIRRTRSYNGKTISNPVIYEVDNLPVCNERESNNSRKNAQLIKLPIIINGRIDRPGDTDVFRLQGRAGDKIAAEVFGRRLNSPLDSLLRLMDSSGKILQWNDDYVIKDRYLFKDRQGIITHHADSYLLAELPKDGTYYISLADVEHHGGPAYGYRLHLSPPQPDFALRLTPSSLIARSGGIVPVDVYVLRKDGFSGAIEVALKDAPAGFQLNGGHIPAGCEHIRMTLTAPVSATNTTTELHLEGKAVIDGRELRHPVVPAEKMMQAFLYQHLVPSQELLFAIQKSRRRIPPVVLAGQKPLQIPAGGSTQVLFRIRRRSLPRVLNLKLIDPPQGLSLKNVTVSSRGISFRIQADKTALEHTRADNLIVEVSTVYTVKNKKGKPTKQKRRASLGVLPAIPIEIVRQYTHHD